MEIELHSAFVWDCDECGAENFERAIEGNIDEAALAAAENQIVPELIATDADEREDGMMESAILVQRICVAPNYVKCSSCGNSFSTTVPMIYDEDDV